MAQKKIVYLKKNLLTFVINFYFAQEEPNNKKIFSLMKKKLAVLSTMTFAIAILLTSNYSCPRPSDGPIIDNISCMASCHAAPNIELSMTSILPR